MDRDPLLEIGKVLLFFGALLIAVGALLTFGTKLLAPWMGRLPGDIIFQRKNFTFYFPLTTSLVVSVVVTLILWIASLLGRK